MSTILTDDEIATAIAHLYAGPEVLAMALPDELHSARAVEAAVLAKLAQQEPAGHLRADPDDGHVFEPRVDGDWSALGKDLYLHPAPQQADRQRVPDEPDWRHPKIQALIGADARNRICIDLIWRILENPRGEFTAGDMEYWDKLHDKVQEVALAAAPEAPAQASPVDERAEFEAWAIDQPYIAAKNLWDERSRYGEEEYESHEVQLMWEAWKARAALAQKGGAA